jgi:hypothetical protein
VYLVPCIAPKGKLDRAPRTSLCEDSASESWDGFWCEERYVTRCTRADGSVAWFRIAETPATHRWHSAATRVLAFPRREDAR